MFHFFHHWHTVPTGEQVSIQSPYCRLEKIMLEEVRDECCWCGKQRIRWQAGDTYISQSRVQPKEAGEPAEEDV